MNDYYAKIVLKPCPTSPSHHLIPTTLQIPFITIMLQIKPILSVILWLAFSGLVDALSWNFQHEGSLIKATVDGPAPDCGGVERRRYVVGELISYAIKCGGKEVFKYDWKDGDAKSNILDLPLLFQTEDSYFPPGQKCLHTVSSYSLFTFPPLYMRSVSFFFTFLYRCFTG